MKLSEIKKIMEAIPESVNLQKPESIRKAMESLSHNPDLLYQELEMESRFVDTHRDVSYSNDMVGLHSHNFYELLCCNNTCGAEYLVGSDRYRLQKGDIVLVPPGVSHRPILPPDMPEPYIRCVLWISPEFIHNIAAMYSQQGLYQPSMIRLLRTYGTKWEYLEDLFVQGVQEAERKDTGWEALVASNAIRLLVLIHRAIHDHSARPMRAEKPELLDNAITYIEAHLTDRITLADVARYLYVSESTISQTFRKKMGVSFHRCLTQRRLVKSKILIGQGVPMEQVGTQVGFQDYSCFYRAFKSEYGISPAQYRKIIGG